MDELRLEAKVDKLDAVLAFVDERLEALDCPMKAQMQIDLAIDELFCNIAKYAYAPDTGDMTIGFSFDPESRLASITFKDNGIPFDPLAKKDPDVSLPASERQIGGLGIFLVKKTMDGMEYRYENGQNILTIHKHI